MVFFLKILKQNLIIGISAVVVAAAVADH